MNNVTVLSHPLIKHKLSIIRDKNTSTKQFKECLDEIAGLMAYEISKDFETVTTEIETPICKCNVEVLAKDIVIVPILRAGLGMVDGIRNLIPTAKVGHVGLYRDEETLEPQTYYAKFPKEIQTGTVLLIDPMLATGGSLVAAIDILQKAGAKEIIYTGLVGAPEGIKRVQEAHPEVKIFLAALDEKLNDKGYIVPGLGDCGDRIFGTK